MGLANALPLFLPPIGERKHGNAGGELRRVPPMITYETSTTIQGSPSKVFRYLSTVGLYPEWMNMESAEVMTPGTQGRGQRWRGKTREGVFVVENSEYEENRVVGFRTVEGPFDWSGGFRIEPLEPGGTRITSYGTIKLPGWRRLMGPLMAGQVRKGEAAELATLKGLVEA